MGLTHYWRRPPILLPRDFARAVDDCQEILPQLGVALADGPGPAVIKEDRISFNGVPPQRCESFVVRQRERPQRDHLYVFSFTKTNGLPYDLCVRVALIILQQHLGSDLEVNSDDAHWDEACKLCVEHLGYGREFHLGR